MVLISIAIVLTLATVGGGAKTSMTTINPFKTPADLKMLQTNYTQVRLVPDPTDPARHALRIEFQPTNWPNVMFTPQKPWDWSQAGGLAFTVTNPGTTEVSFHLRADDDIQSNGIAHCCYGTGAIQGGHTIHYVLPLGKSDPMAYGMRGLPPASPGAQNLQVGNNGPFNFNHVVRFQIFLDHPASPQALIVANLHLTPPASLDHIVDRFGQYTGATWPGKVAQKQQLIERRQREVAELRAHPALPDRDRFGGWAKGPRLEGTGFFRTQKLNGKWWLVDPEGHLFFSMGMDCVTMGGITMVSGRRTMFNWMPSGNSPLAQFLKPTGSVLYGPTKSGEAFNFYKANLYRKYGPGYEQDFYRVALDRLRAWGFNTIGNWSDPRLYRNGQVPYVATGGVSGDFDRIASGSDYWGKMPDPFDPRFATAAVNSLSGLANEVKGDPWCLGYFVDNELSWAGGPDGGRYGLAIGTLAAGADSAAKQSFIADLKAKYKEIADLNRAWNTQFSSWEALDAPYRVTEPFSDAMKEDMAAFVKSYALQYFKVVHDTLKQLDPNHLYLGCRFAWYVPSEVEAAARYCDVISFNIYAPKVDAHHWAFLQKIDKPCVIGEFHFGSLDRGMFMPGLVYTPNQAARAQMYMDYLQSVIANPSFVGCHWFEYVDEPLTGRTWDGENYNIGFVSVTDTPYREMVAAAEKVQSTAYSMRWDDQKR